MVRARGLAAELKELRDKSGLSTREAAARVGVSSATINRIENAHKAVDLTEVSALLVAYGVTGNERVRILELAREAEQRGRWLDSGSEYQGVPKQLTALMSFEAEATAITMVNLLVIPGMLQTHDYTRAMLACFDVPQRESEQRVIVRSGRQVALTKPRPPMFTAFIDEAALRRPMGGPRVMAEQLRHIVHMTRRPNVDVRVIPFDRGGHWGIISPFVLLEFAKADPIVHLEHIRSSALLDEPEDVAPYHTAKARLAVAALGPAESEDLLLRVSAEYDER
jgi:transcriptional regulator with XRE-family HTH domain